MKGLILTSFVIIGFSLGIYSSSANESITMQEQQIKQKQINERLILILREKQKQAKIYKANQERKQLIIARYKQAQLQRKEQIFNSAENIEYKYNLDITDNMIYNRIQERSLSCELSATSDILSYLENRKISETSIINMVEKDQYNELPKQINGKTVWGNPNRGYVGYIDKLDSGKKATQSGMTGYGVLEKPIAKIYDKFNYVNKIITNESYNEVYNENDHLTELLKNLNAGNMVQLWGDYCTQPEFEDTERKNSCSRFGQNRSLEWYYEENGEYIKYTGLAGEHAFYLLGYQGGIHTPSHITVWDTQTGKHTYPISEWMRKWNKMDNKSIIIYKKS